MLDVGTQPSPVSSWCASTRRSSARAGGARAGRSGVPRARRRRAGGPAPSGTGRGTPASPPGSGDVAEVRDPAERRVVGEQHLAAPDRAVGAVAGAVEGDPDHRLVAGRARARPSPTATWAWWCCTVRTGAARRRARGPRRRSGSRGARSATSSAGRDAGERLEVPLGARRTPASVARSSMSPTCWLTARRSGPSASAEGVLQVGADGERRPDRRTAGRRQRRVARGSGAPAARSPSTTRTTESSHGTWIGRSWRSHASASARQPLAARRRRR